tara:strand:- start:301 stop:1002 length:702 start_codon:yes stop_codon:yes gene_type:complete
VLFNNFKTSSVGYIINEFECPKGIVPNIEKYSNLIYKTKCPSVSSIHNRLYYANSILDVDIEFGIKNNQPYYNYNFTDEHPPSDLMHNLVRKIVHVQPLKNNASVHLQVHSPYSFITDVKDIELVNLPIDVESENCVYVPGGLKPYYWIRNFSSAFLLDDETKQAKVKLRIDKPILSFYFNKPVNLKLIEETEAIKSYREQNAGIVNFRNNLEKYYMNVISRRPKKLLQGIAK